MTNDRDERMRRLRLMGRSGGGSLSERFAEWPSDLSHPALISSFYALLIAPAVLIPVGLTESWSLDSWLRRWAVEVLGTVLVFGIIGGAAAFSASVTGRDPITLPRRIAFLTPFIGAALRTFWAMAPDRPDILLILGNAMLWLPGLAWVWLSWAPRHYRLTTPIDLVEESDVALDEDVESVIEESMTSE
ncbi:MAG TPA: hypothetical protein QF646_01115, partial [Candidatus Poseidoniales archaeon]|nr:hypothetical protein [Candidatus Poseidoniales archaeon]